MIYIVCVCQFYLYIWHIWLSVMGESFFGNFFFGWLVGWRRVRYNSIHAHTHTNKHHTQKHGRVVDFGRILLVPVILCIYTTTIFVFLFLFLFFSLYFFFSFVVFFLLGFTICHSTLMLPYDTIHTHTHHISLSSS